MTLANPQGRKTGWAGESPPRLPFPFSVLYNSLLSFDLFKGSPGQKFKSPNLIKQNLFFFGGTGIGTQNLLSKHSYCLNHSASPQNPFFTQPVSSLSSSWRWRIDASLTHSKDLSRKPSLIKNSILNKPGPFINFLTLSDSPPPPTPRQFFKSYLSPFSLKPYRIPQKEIIDLRKLFSHHRQRKRSVSAGRER
jgi:hypothetical protein